METQQISGQVKNASLCLPIEGTFIEALNEMNKTICSSYSDKNGNWTLNNSTEISKIRFQKEQYVTKEISRAGEIPPVIRLIENQLIGYCDKLWFYR